MHAFRRAVLLLAALGATSASARTLPPPSGGGEPLTVFAAASLQGPLDTVAARWTEHSGRDVRIAYAATSSLARQITQGAPADVFIAADREWMDWLAEQGFVDEASRFDLVGNELVLVAPRTTLPVAGAAPEELLPGELGTKGKLAVADVYTVPAGRYAKQALQAIDRWDDVSGRLAMADNVRAALAFVARGEAPLGIVYATDAKAEPDVRVVARFAAGTHVPIVYPAARVATAAAARGPARVDAAVERRGEGRDAAAFLAWLRSPEAVAMFAAAGFTRPDDVATAR